MLKHKQNKIREDWFKINNYSQERYYKQLDARYQVAPLSLGMKAYELRN